MKLGLSSRTNPRGFLPAIAFSGVDLRGLSRSRGRRRPWLARTSAKALLLALTMRPSSASAEPDRADAPAPHEGFEAQVEVGATLNFNDNRNVVGQTTGSSLTFGQKFDATTSWIRGPHEARAALNLVQSLVRTARLPVLVKSQDLLRFEVVYLYRLLDWAGTFARLGGDGPLLAGYDDRVDPVTYSIEDRSGTTRTVTTSHLPLTGVGRPFNFKESAGLFARLRRSEPLNVEVRAGAAGRQTIADGQLALRDVSDTPTIEVFELESYQQVGPELSASAWGKLREGLVTYRIGIDVMVPIHHTFYTVDRQADEFDLMNVDAFASLSVKVVEWASLDYDLRVVRQPQLVEQTQIRNNLLLTFGFRRGTEKKPVKSDNPLDRVTAEPTPITPQRNRVGSDP
jgi:hypothetical protein